MTNLELRRRVGRRPRRRSVPTRAEWNDLRRPHDGFMRLPEDECVGVWEMDTVEGSAADPERLFTLYHRPTNFQLAIPVEDGTCEAVRRRGARRR